MIIFNLRCKFFLQTASKTKIEIMKTIITLTLSSLLFIITACNLKKEKISQHHFHGILVMYTVTPKTQQIILMNMLLKIRNLEQKQK
jgi:NhaP-type Na+/H+ or K+/H+ antiporter